MLGMENGGEEKQEKQAMILELDDTWPKKYPARECNESVTTNIVAETNNYYVDRFFILK